MSSKTKARKAQRGVPLNIMVVGSSGTGKSTFVKALVGKELIPARDHEEFNDLSEKTVDISSYSEDIDADGQRVILTVIDTPGFGDNINNSKGFVRILSFVENQHKRFLAEETRVQRNAKFQDTRVHLILYFVPPTGHCLRDIDIVFMKQLGRRANILPVIAKADSLTTSELKEFKKRVVEDIAKYEIPIFDFPVNSDDDEDVIQENTDFKNLLPYAIVASDRVHEAGGKKGLGRKYPWGVVFVENEQESDFTKLKFIMLISHLEVLKDVTNDVHYENFRQESLTKGGSVDSQKLEEELMQFETAEKDFKDKEKAAREKRIAMRSNYVKSSPKIQREDSNVSVEEKKKKSSKSKKTGEEDEEGKKKKKKKEKGEEKGEEKEEGEEEQ